MFKHILRSGVYDRDSVSRETGMFDDQESFPSKTIQSAKDDADINVIVKRFGVGVQVSGPGKQPSYGDYTGVGDFQTAMNVVRLAEEQFMALPSGLRSRFGNNPQAYLEFCTDPENIPEMIRLGIASRVDSANMESSGKAIVKEKTSERDIKKRVGKADKASGRSEGDSDGE